MKRFLISMAALLAVVGCAKQDDLVSAEFGTANAPEFEVGFETSRVYIEEDGDGYKLSWTQGDLLSCFFNTGGQAKYEYVGETGADNGIIKAVSCPSGTTLDKFYAVYPYNEGNKLTGDVLTVVLPSEQTYAEGTFGANSNTMVAVNPNGEPYYTFSNVCGYLRLNVYGNANIKSIKIEGNNGEIIAGEATYDTTNGKLTMTGNGKAISLVSENGVAVGKTVEEATSFWFVIPVATFEKGFKVTITDVDGCSSVKNLIDEYEVVRNQVKSAKLEVDIDHGFNSGIIFDAKFNDDGSASDVGAYNLDIQTITGEFMSVVKDDTYGNVAQFTQGATNSPQNHSYYYVDYSADNETNNAFKADLNDGFTMEVIASCGEWSADPWQYAVAGNTFGLLHVGGFSYARIMGCGDANKNNQFGNMTEGDHDAHAFRVDLNKYHHYVYVWNAALRHIRLYVDGVMYTEGLNWGVNAGHRLAIGGYPAYADNAPEIRMPYDGKIATTRIYSTPMTKEQIESRAKTLNFWVYDESVVEPGNALFDAKFEGTTATNVGTMQSLVIDNSLLGTNIVSAVKRGTKNLVKFYRSVKDNNPTTEGAYLIDYSTNDEFKATLTDGFTMEVICKVDHYTGNMWSKVMAGTCYGIQHDMVDGGVGNPPSWGLFANGQENKWATAPAGGWQFAWTRNVALQNFEHLLYTYDKEAQLVTLYLNGEKVLRVTYDGFNAGNMLAIGALPYTDKTFYHPFVGEIAMARVYDNKCNKNWAKVRYNELLPTIQELNSAPTVEVPAPMVDVRFNTNETATDIAGNYTIEAVMNENTLSVVSPNSDYNLNNIAQYRPITDANGAPQTASYFKLSYENIPELQKAMDDGLSIEVIYCSVNRPWDVWQGLYGNETVRLTALGWRYGGGWTMWLTDNAGKWYYNNNSALRPERGEIYYHNVYVRNNETQDYSLYTNGNLDYYKSMGVVNQVSTTMAIGAAYNQGPVLTYYWQGNIALFRIYDEPLTREQALQAYANIKPQLDALNATSYIK